MDFYYEIKNRKLKKMAENKAQELGISLNQLILRYINRGLMEDGFSEEIFYRLHSEKFLKKLMMF